MKLQLKLLEDWFDGVFSQRSVWLLDLDLPSDPLAAQALLLARQFELTNVPGLPPSADDWACDLQLSQGGASLFV